MNYTIKKIETKKRSLGSRSYSFWIYRGERKLYGPYFSRIDAQMALMDIKISSL